VVAVLAATLVVGAAVQGLVGLGLALVAAPVTVLLEPRLMPDLLLWLAMLLPVVTLVREHHDIDWPALGWSVSARIPGTAVGVYLVSIFTDRTMGIAIGVMVLVSVLLTARAVVVPVNRATLSSAGFVSGITGTATAIGGPPIALLLQHRSPRQLRSTLGVYFLVGAALSLLGLGLAGDLEPATALLAALLTPCLVVGFALARLLDRLLPRRHVRTGVLVVCAGSSLVLLVRSLL
jgi:uncharacterized membrane protein YfcA